MLFRIGRSVACVTQLDQQCFRTARRVTQLRRVTTACTGSFVHSSSSNGFKSPLSTSGQARSYATKPAKPKAHQGTTAKARKPRAKASTTKTAKTPKKPTSKAKAKPKPKPKAKKSAKPKRRPKKVLSEEQKAAQKTAKQAKAKRTRLADLQKLALSPPKRSSVTAFSVLLTEMSQKFKPAPAAAKEASSRYKSLSPEEREHYNHLANQNKAKYESAYRSFIASHSPLEIKKANTARTLLGRLQNKEYLALRDERLPQHPQNAYSFFATDRHRSGDFAGIPTRERFTIIAREWQALSDTEKKVYEARSKEDLERYTQEHKTVYGTPPAYVTRAEKAASSKKAT